MATLSKLERWLFRRLMKKCISGDNRQQMWMFSELYKLDEVVHYEDNYATRRHWYLKWFCLAFAPDKEMGKRIPQIGDKVYYSGDPNSLRHKYGRVVGITVSWENQDRSTVSSPNQIEVCDGPL